MKSKSFMTYRVTLYLTVSRDLSSGYLMQPFLLADDDIKLTQIFSRCVVVAKEHDINNLIHIIKALWNCHRQMKNVTP